MNKLDHRSRVAAERRERMRRRLFASALQVVAAHGPARASIDQVIQSADVSRGSFYNYFESPEALFDELAVEVTNEIIRMAEPVVARLRNPAERVGVGMRLVIRLASAQREVAAFLARLGWPDAHSGPVLLDFVRRDIDEGLRSGCFVAMPVALALRIVSMTVLGAVHEMLAPRCTADFAEQAVASALRALGVAHAEAERIATLELAAPGLLEGGLLTAEIRGGLAKNSEVPRPRTRNFSKR